MSHKSAARLEALAPFARGFFLIKNREKVYWGHDELQENRWLCSAGGSFFLE
jgi:hypothetical protein